MIFFSDHPVYILYTLYNDLETITDIFFGLYPFRIYILLWICYAWFLSYNLLKWSGHHGFCPFCRCNNFCPQYMTHDHELLDFYNPSRPGLRSANKTLLVQPKSSRSWGDRAFSVAAPRIWNNLPNFIRSCSSIESFKSLLKKHFFKLAYELV